MSAIHENDLAQKCLSCPECINFGASAVIEKVWRLVQYGRDHGGVSGSPELERVARAIIRLRILAGVAP